MSWNIPKRKQSPRLPEVRDRWTGDSWVEARVLERNGSLSYVEDTDGRGTPLWVSQEDLR